jgi:UDP-2-acetamido-2-deoxy-ribo-hexuluronate aminotransferase
VKIDFANLKYQHNLYKEEIEEAIFKVARNCNFIMGEEVATLENSLEEFTKAKYAISCSSGTDALLLALMALDIKPDDEIITTPFTFIATAEVIALVGAKPVFVDIDEQTYNIDVNKIEQAISTKTKAIIPVSLYGQPCDMDSIEAIAKKYNLKVVVDGAQSFGSTYKNKTDSALGDISTTSFFPAKPLGCYGDGGALFTSDDSLASKIKSLRVHGQTKRYHHQYIGIGGRLDTIQAAVLLVKLKYYATDLAKRQEVANRYTTALQNKDAILPYVAKESMSAWAQYSIRIQNRDALQEKLKQAGVPTAIHYPKPLHLQECFGYLGYGMGDFPVAEMIANEILSLPMNPYIDDETIAYIVKLFEER